MSDDLDFDMEVIGDDELDDMGADGASSSAERSRPEIEEDATDRYGKSTSSVDGVPSLGKREKVSSEPSSGRSKAELSDRNTTAEWGALGAPPEEWGTEYLGEKFEVIKDSVDPSGYSGGDEIVLHSMPAYDEGEGPVRVEAGSIGSKKFRVPSHALLFPKLNITKKRFWLVKERHNKPALCSTEYWPLVPKGDLNLEYYHQLFGADAFINKPRLSTSATTNSHQRIKSNLFEKVRLPVPPLPEQRKIASVLYAVDQAIQKTEAIIEQAQRVKRGLMQDLLTRGIDETGHLRSSSRLESPDEPAEVVGGVLWSRIEAIPPSWEMGSLGTEVSIQSGFNAPSKNFTKEGGIPLIRNRDLDSTATEVNYDGEFPEACLIENGDLLVSMDGEFKPRLWRGGRALLNQRVCKIETSSKLDIKFLRYALEEPLYLIQKSTAGTTVKHLSKSDIRGVNLPTPPLQEQREIAGRLHTVEEFVEQNNEHVLNLKRLKKGLMQDLLTGEVRTVDKAIEVLDEVAAHG